MSDYTLRSCLISAALGALSHLTVFINGEWDNYAFLFTYIFVTAPLFLFPPLAVLGYREEVQSSAAILFSYVVGVWSSMSIYRVYYHPLRHFPGPLVAKISSFWCFQSAVVEAKWHTKVEELHKQHGDFVRIKPREISINDPVAIKEIHGGATTCSKGCFYDLVYPLRSLQMARDKAFHSKRRRIWDRGFSTRALAGYEPVILEHCNEFVRQISSHAQDPVEVTDSIAAFAWDAMGFIAWGKPFDMVKGVPNPMLDSMRKLKRAGSFIHCAPWAIRLIRNLPLISRGTAKWIDWCWEQVEERRKMDLNHRDLFSYLIEDSLSDTSHPLKATDGDLVYDSELAIAAGSDTTAGSMSILLFLLAKHPEILRQLREEVDAALPPGTPLSHTELVGAPVLEGCINECLRLYPAVPSGLPRETGPKGLIISGVFIPAFTTVSVPTYTIQRDPRNFKQPDDFIPERWYSEPELILRKEAFFPFSYGPYICAGKAFGMMEMRLCIAAIVRSFDFRFPPGKEESLPSLGGSGVMDCFTATIPDFHLIFEKREVATV